MLNDPLKYELINQGIRSTTMMKTGDLPYWDTFFYKDALNSKADFFIMLMGKNDAKRNQWNQNQNYLD